MCAVIPLWLQQSVDRALAAMVITGTAASEVEVKVAGELWLVSVDVRPKREFILGERFDLDKMTGKGDFGDVP